MDKSKNDTIFQEERREQILKILEDEQRVATNELIKKFDTTAVTIRKDLAVLEQEGFLRRTHGGAIKSKKLYQGLALNEKEKLRLDEKLRIVKEAAKLILEGDTIILDSGSTTSLLAKEIKNLSGITVITNAINIASELLQSKIEVILTGGTLLKESSTLVGPLAEGTLRKISSGKLFQGVDGVDFEIGLTTPNIFEANTSRVMMSVAGETIILVDSSKFGRRSLGVISKIDEIDKIITTKELSVSELELFTNSNVEVTMV